MSAVRRTLTLLAGLFAGFVLSVSVLPAVANAATPATAATSVASASAVLSLPAAPEQPEAEGV